MIRRTEPVHGVAAHSSTRTANQAAQKSTPGSAWDQLHALCLAIYAQPTARRGNGQDLADETPQENRVRRWRTAQGKVTPDSVDGSGRSTFKKFYSARRKQWLWEKTFQTDNFAYSANEISALVFFGLSAQRDLRAHVAYAATLSGRHDSSNLYGTVETPDVGPTLQDWMAFAAVVADPANGRLAPLFAHPAFLAALAHQALVALQSFEIGRASCRERVLASV